MITEIILIICAVAMTTSGLYFMISDIRARVLRAQAIKRQFEKIQKQKEAQNIEPKQGA